MNRLLLICLVSLPLMLPAQNFGGGLILGLNMGQIDGDLEAGFRQPGLFLGGFVNYRLRPSLSFQPEIVVEQLGSRSRFGSFSPRLTLASLHTVLQGRIAFDLGDVKQEVLLEAGPAIGFVVGAVDTQTGMNETGLYDRVDLRGVAGGTYQFSPRWGFSFRYGYSLISFSNTSRTILLAANHAATGAFHNYVNFSLRYIFIER